MGGGGGGSHMLIKEKGSVTHGHMRLYKKDTFIQSYYCRSLHNAEISFGIVQRYEFQLLFHYV